MIRKPLSNLRILPLILVLFACSDGNEIEISEAYWGCWREANNTVGVFDLILIENQSEPHGIGLGTNCVLNENTGIQDIGVLRDDTLILDNGVNEFWCFIQNDTLLYSANVSGAELPIEKFIKVQ